MTLRDRVIVIGAGAGGLAAAVDLARSGTEVTVLERAATPGGKMRHVPAGGALVDGGPTVFTMRWIFEGLFSDAGADLASRLDLTPATVLARHAWRSGGQLDLFADIDRSAEAIAAFSGKRDADGYRAFCKRGADVYQSLVKTFIASERPSSPVDLVFRAGIGKVFTLLRSEPLKSLWSAVGEHFEDPRLKQLFGRYATYVGSSPFLAPATLMLIAHVEQDGVWLVKGGMRRVADALQELGAEQGATYRWNTHVDRIVVERGRVAGVVLASGEHLDADAIVFAGDVSALGTGLLGGDVTNAATATPREARSLSAVTWCINGRTRGFPLLHHNVFFAEDYQREFDAIFESRTITAAPTVYVCAQDRGAGLESAVLDHERLLVLINAPPDGDRGTLRPEVVADLESSTFGLLQACGLEIGRPSEATVVTTPSGFNSLFPATGGALYGRASHGANATFQRSRAITKVPGLYLAGGSVHPGAGVPMATMSGRLAAARLLEDRAASRAGRRPADYLSISCPY